MDVTTGRVQLAGHSIQFLASALLRQIHLPDYFDIAGVIMIPVHRFGGFDALQTGGSDSNCLIEPLESLVGIFE